MEKAKTRIDRGRCSVLAEAAIAVLAGGKLALYDMVNSSS